MTLSQIVDDIMLTCYYVDKEKSEKLLRRQVEAWVHQYRLLLLKQEISKNSIVDPSYISYWDYTFKKDPVLGDIGGLVIPRKGAYVYESIEELPELAPLIGRLGITSVIVSGINKDIYPPFDITWYLSPQPITVADMSRAMYGHYDIWNQDKMIASIYNEKQLILWSYKEIPYLVTGSDPDDPIILAAKATCGLILANPTDMNQEFGDIDYKEEEYPIPIDRIPRLKQMIYSSELQWLMPSRDTAQSAQMAKVEEQEIMNNPNALLQVGADVMDGMQ